MRFVTCGVFLFSEQQNKTIISVDLSSCQCSQKQTFLINKTEFEHNSV